MEKASLIVFAKLPEPGKVKTRLGEAIGMEQAAEVYRQFAAHAFSLAHELDSEGATVYVFYAPGAAQVEVERWVGHPYRYLQQRGNDLGERMRNAFDTAFADGAVKSVIIGTDVPELEVDIIKAAFDALTTTDVVLGPSTDGGYYLLGMKERTEDLFSNIEWSSGHVLEQTLRRVRQLNLTYYMLQSLADVDTAEDYAALLARLRSG